MFTYKNVNIHWLGHDGFLLQYGGKNVYIDPFKIGIDTWKSRNLIYQTGLIADYLLITHDHFDHLSPEDIVKVVDVNTVVIASEMCREKLEKLNVKEIKYVKPHQNILLWDFELKTLPAYNTDKFRTPWIVFHPKESGYVWYVLMLWETAIYHTGDTDMIPEMGNLNVDVVLLPVSGTYVMTWQEAVEAVKLIYPKVAIPIHYGSVVWSVQDAENFKKYASCKVEILEKF